MKASDITRIINDLEHAIDLAGSEPIAEDFKSLLVRMLDMKEQNMAPVLAVGANMIGRNSNLRGENRIKLFRDWHPTDYMIDIISNVMKSYVSWEYPCLEIFPGDGAFLPFVLGAEPLYIADWDRMLLEDVSKQFNEYYASKRLMKYVIKDYDLSPLPQDSFGFIYCVNWLRFEDLSGLNRLAKAVYDCLMPGGVYLFVFNPSDKWWGVSEMETGYGNGADTVELTKSLESIGFEVKEIQHQLHNVSHVICKRPGEIRYIKSSSVLGKIIDNNSNL